MKSFQFYSSVPEGEESEYKAQTKRQLVGIGMAALFLSMFMGIVILITLVLVAIG